jgi:transposase InsO family protein
MKDDEDEVTAKIIELATQYGRYGYRRITAMLKTLGYDINHKRVERIWKENGLKVPKKQPKRKRLWLNDGSCIRLRPEYKNHVWSYDFVTDQLENKKKLRWLNIIDEYSRICIFSEPRRNWRHQDIIEVLSDCFILHGVPTHMRSDNGPEFIAKELRKWFKDIGVITSYIEPGSPWENGYCESFNSKMRDEFLNMEVFSTLNEAKALAKQWVIYYNTIRPHSSLNYQPPAPLTVQELRS